MAKNRVKKQMRKGALEFHPEVVQVYWFGSPIGIVIVENPLGARTAYIGYARGDNEVEDIEQIKTKGYKVMPECLNDMLRCLRRGKHVDI